MKIDITKQKLISYISIIISILIITLIFSNINILIVGLIGVIILIKLCSNYNDKEIRAITIILITSIILMVILYYGYLYKYSAPYYLGKSDDYQFEMYAKSIVEQGIWTPKRIKAIAEYKYLNGIGYIWTVSMLYRFCNLFGEYTTIVPRIINIFVFTYMCILTNNYFKRYNCKKSVFSIYMLGLLPNAIYTSIHVFRDTISAFFILLIFYIWDKRFKLNKYVKYFTSSIILYFAYWFREINIIYILIIIIIELFLNKKIRVSKIKILVLGLTLIILIKIFGIDDILINYNDSYNNYMTNISDGMSRVIFKTRLFPFGIFIRFIYGLMYPFPAAILTFINMFKDIDIFFNVIISIGTIIQIMFIPYLLKGLINFKREHIIFLLLYISIILTTFGFRHFIIIYPFISIIVGEQVINYNYRKVIIQILSVFYIIVIMGGIYLLIK